MVENRMVRKIRSIPNPQVKSQIYRIVHLLKFVVQKSSAN